MAFMVCPDCKKKLPENVAVCGKCGKAFEEGDKPWLKAKYDAGVNARVCGGFAAVVISHFPAFSYKENGFFVWLIVLVSMFWGISTFVEVFLHDSVDGKYGKDKKK